MKKPLEVIIVGAGNRAMIYSQYALMHPEEMKIVGVAEPSDVRRIACQKKYDIKDSMCFKSCEELCEHEKLADAVINGTMDHHHVPTSKMLLRKGYDILLEKPFAITEEEMYELSRVAKEENRKVMICHVLRYAPFYRKIKETVLSGELGDVYNIQLTEHVSYHHTVAAYVRGKWASPKECLTGMLLAKSCHDLDLMMWMMDNTTPVDIASFGSDFNFIKEKKPEIAGTRCMVDCPLVDECTHSAKRNYLASHNRWAPYVWKALETDDTDVIYGMEELDAEIKENSLKTDNPFGRCVWDCERDGNVDHQSVIINFDNGATATFNMIGNTASAQRSIHIIGTKGELKGVFNEQKYTIRKPVPESDDGYKEEVIDLNITGDMTGAHGGHGGGDLKVPEDFVRFVNGETASVSCTSLDKSIIGHLAAFRAEKSRKEHKIVSMVN